MKGLLKFILIIVIIAIVLLIGAFIGAKFTSNNSLESEKKEVNFESFISAKDKQTTTTSSNKVYVEGIETPVSFKEIINTAEENDARFEELYEQKQVKFTGTVEKVITEMTGGSIKLDIIVFKEDWQVEIPSGFCEKLSQLNKGDKLEVTSKIIGAVGLYGDMLVNDCGERYSSGIKTKYNRTSIKFNGEEICKIVE